MKSKIKMFREEDVWQLWDLEKRIEGELEEEKRLSIIPEPEWDGMNFRYVYTLASAMLLMIRDLAEEIEKCPLCGGQDISFRIQDEVLEIYCQNCFYERTVEDFVLDEVIIEILEEQLEDVRKRYFELEETVVRASNTLRGFFERLEEEEERLKEQERRMYEK